MRILKAYYPLSIHLILILAGYLFINAGLAFENSTKDDPQNKSKNTKEGYIPISYYPNYQKTGYQAIDNEKELELEYWMTHSDFNNWNNPSITDQENEIIIEEWMTDLDYWNN